MGFAKGDLCHVYFFTRIKHYFFIAFVITLLWLCIILCWLCISTTLIIYSALLERISSFVFAAHFFLCATFHSFRFTLFTVHLDTANSDLILQNRIGRSPIQFFLWT